MEFIYILNTEKSPRLVTGQPFTDDAADLPEQVAFEFQGGAAGGRCPPVPLSCCIHVAEAPDVTAVTELGPNLNVPKSRGLESESRYVRVRKPNRTRPRGPHRDCDCLSRSQRRQVTEVHG